MYELLIVNCGRKLGLDNGDIDWFSQIQVLCCFYKTQV